MYRFPNVVMTFALLIARGESSEENMKASDIHQQITVVLLISKVETQRNESFSFS